MQFRLYLLDVNELVDDNLRQRAFLLMDRYRREKVYKYRIMKDRLHQIATGLLLQVGLLELEINEKKLESDILLQDNRYNDAEREYSIAGDIYLCQAGEVVRLLESYNGSNVQCGLRVPMEAEYGQKQCGKPYWKREFLEKIPSHKKFPHFNISHSGEYAALVICDEEVGLDIQNEKQTRYEGGCKEFSRMEAYVKCTGEGYAKGYQKYNELKGEVSDVCFFGINALQDYVIWLCHFKEKS